MNFNYLKKRELQKQLKKVDKYRSQAVELINNGAVFSDPELVVLSNKITDTGMIACNLWKELNSSKFEPEVPNSEDQEKKDGKEFRSVG